MTPPPVAWRRILPPAVAVVVVLTVFSSGYGCARRLFPCHVVDRLDDGVGVDNEEQGEPAAVCTEPQASWPVLWNRLHHLDRAGVAVASVSA